MFEYFYRLYNLFRKNSRARPLNARKSWVWQYTPVGCLVGKENANGVFSWTFSKSISPLSG